MVSEALVFPLRKRASVTRNGCKRRDEGDAEEEETGAMMMAMKETKKRSSTSRRRAKGRAALASVMKAIVVLACVVLATCFVEAKEEGVTALRRRNGSNREVAVIQDSPESSRRASSVQNQCRMIVTYTAGYFLTQGYSDYPFFMGFVDINAPSASFLGGGGGGSKGSSSGRAENLIEWNFPNNETLISVTPESETRIESGGEPLFLEGGNGTASQDGDDNRTAVKIWSEVDHFKFIAHREHDNNLDSPSKIVLNGEVCEEIMYSDVVDDPDSTVRASAASRELTEGAFNENPGVLLFYTPDQKSLESKYPKIFTEFNASIVNVGFKPLAVSSISIKYYFKNPGLSPWQNPSSETWTVSFSDCMEIFGSYHNPSPIDCDKLGLSATVRPLKGNSVPGADYVMDVTFGERDLWLSPIEDLGNVSILESSTGDFAGFNLTNPTGILIQPKLQLDFYTQNNGYFLRMNETEDYSFRPPTEDGKWIINQNITVDVNNNTVWGTDLEGGSMKFQVVGSENVGLPGARCNGLQGGGNSTGVGCMVIKRYCCSGGGGGGGIAPMHGDGSHSKVWVYVLIGVGGLVLISILSLGAWLYWKRRAAIKGNASGGLEGGRKRQMMRYTSSGSSGLPLAVSSGTGNTFLNPILGHLSQRDRTLSLSLRELTAPVSTPSPDYSPTSALSIFRNPFAVLPQSPKLALPDLFATSGGDLFEVINPSDVRPLRFIGSGAFGSVYEAVLEKQGRVAVKLVNIRNMTDSSSKIQLESFKREVDVLSRVNHVNVVKLHGACMCPPNVFIVMELMEGSLRDKLDEVGRLSYRDILKLANEISSALAYLHPSIVHRDLKPQNILMGSDGSAKVADFGIAKFKQSTYLNTTRGNGTPSYMAPESFGSEKISEKADVFSLGMILWECLTGDSPWKEVDIPFQVVMLVGVEKKRPEIPEDCPKQLASLIKRCWDDDPHRRPSCAEVERRTRLLLHALENEGSKGAAMVELGEWSAVEERKEPAKSPEPERLAETEEQQQQQQ